MSRGIVLSWNPPSGSVKIAFVVSQGDTVLLKAFNFMTCIVNFFWPFLSLSFHVDQIFERADDG